MLRHFDYDCLFNPLVPGAKRKKGKGIPFLGVFTSASLNGTHVGAGLEGKGLLRSWRQSMREESGFHLFAPISG